MKGFFKNKWVAASAGVILTSAILVSSFAFLFSDKQNNLVRSAETDPALLDYDAASSVNFTSILGRSIDYGILSSTIDFRDHMETTYATKLLKTKNKGAQSNNSDVDLAGGAPAQFIIADIDEDSKAVFDKTYQGATMDFVIDTTQELVNKDKFQTNGLFNGQLLFRTYSYDELINNLDSMIGRMQKQSKMLADKPAFDGDSFAVITTNGNQVGRAVINLSDSSYENCTIYINVEEDSMLEKAIASENLEIVKHSSTVVVFNMLSSKDITLGQYTLQTTDTMTLDDIPDFATGSIPSDNKINSTTTYGGDESVHNLLNDKYMARSIIWNMPNSTNIDLDKTSGVFIAPKTNAYVNVVDPSAGWIMNAGTTVILKEFHFIFHDRTDVGNTVDVSALHFAARKGFTDSFETDSNGKIKELNNISIGSEDKYTFTFTETESDFVHAKTGATTYQPITNDEYGKITFPTLTYDVRDIDPIAGEDHYFVIKETGKDIKDSVTDSNVSVSTGEIDIHIHITNINGIIHYDVTADKYLTAQDKANNKVFEHDETPMSGAEFSLGAIYNKYDLKTSKVSLTKVVEFENDDGTGFPSDEKFEIALKKGDAFVQKDGTLGCSEYFFEVKANEPLEISGLIPGQYYAVEKNKETIGVFGFVSCDIEYNNDSSATNITLTGEETTATPINVTNTYKKYDVSGSSLEIKKNVAVVGKETVPSVLADKEYQVALYNKSTYKYVQNTFGEEDNNIKWFTVKIDEPLVIMGLQDCSYEVIENVDGAKQQGYNLVQINGVDNPNGNDSCKLTIDSLPSDASVTVNNTYERQVGHFKLSKAFTVNQNNSINPRNVYSNFDTISKDINFVVTGPDGYEKTLNLHDDFTAVEQYGRVFYETELFEGPVGEYTITETGSDKFTNSDYRFNSFSMIKYNNEVQSLTLGTNNETFEIRNDLTQIAKSTIRIAKNVVDNGVQGVGSEFKVQIINSEGLYYKETDVAPYYEFVSDTDAYVTVSTNSFYITKNIPVGKYRIVEIIDADTLVPGAGHEVTITNDGVVNLGQYSYSDVTITNVYTQYSLNVTKNETNPPYQYMSYQFYVKNAAGQYINSLGDLSGAPYYFTFSNGETVVVPIKTQGTYYVYEKDANNSVNSHFDLKTTYTISDQSHDEYGEVVISDDNKSADVTVNNAYEYNHTVSKCDLTISKFDVTNDHEVQGAMLVLERQDGQAINTDAELVLNGGASKILDYTGNGISYTSGTESSVIKNLGDGVYILEETNAPFGYKVADSIKFEIKDGKLYSVNGTLVDSTDTSNKVTMVDEVFDYVLTVNKELTGDTDGLPDTYQFYIKNSSNGYIAEDTAGNNRLLVEKESAKVFEVTEGTPEIIHITVPGTFTIEEINPGIDTHTLSISIVYDSGSNFVVSDKAGSSNGSSVTIENNFTEITGKLTITKTLSGADLADLGSISFSVTGPDGNAVSVPALTNPLPNGWTVDPNNSNKYVYEIAPAKLGTYTVQETSSGIDGKQYTCDTDLTIVKIVELTSSSNEKSADFTNTYVAIVNDYSITVEKSVSGAPDGVSTFSFAVMSGEQYVQNDGTLGTTANYFTVQAEGSKKVAIAAKGPYTVVEQASSAEVSGYKVSTSYEGNDVIITDENTTGTVKITNAYTKIDYSILVSKVATNAPAGKDTFEFTVKKGEQYVNGEGNFQTDMYTFQVANNSEKEVSVPESGTYTVTEVNAEVDDYNLEIKYGTGTDNSVTLSDTDNRGSVEIYNTYSEKTTTEYSIKVSKEVVGINGATGSFQFAVKKVGTDSYVQNDGSLSTNKQLFTVAANGETTVNLNESGIYSVVEEGGEVSGYKLDVSYDKENVTIDDTNVSDSIKITNTYNAISYSIDVSKEASGAPSTVTSYKFTVKYGDKYVNDSCGIQDDVYEFTIEAGETVNIPVPNSGTYIVTEVDANVTGYTLETTYDKQSVTLTDSGNTGSVTITNTYTEVTNTPTDTPTDTPTNTPTDKPTDKPTTTPTTTPTPTTDVTPTPTSSVTPTPVITQAPTPTPSDVTVVKVTVDGAEISDSAYYVDDSGNVKLTTDYVNGLPGGKHTMVTSFSDGSALTTEFEVTKTSNNSNNQVTSTSGVVATGESYREGLIQIAEVLMLIAVTLIFYRKRFLEN